MNLSPLLSGGKNLLNYTIIYRTAQTILLQLSKGRLLSHPVHSRRTSSKTANTIMWATHKKRPDFSGLFHASLRCLLLHYSSGRTSSAGFGSSDSGFSSSSSSSGTGLSGTFGSTPGSESSICSSFLSSFLSS